MSAFLTPLSTTLVDRRADDGTGLWRLNTSFVYQSDLAGILVVPAGFCTDFASVPRIPVAYWFAGGLADEPAVVHDYLYSTGKLARDKADAVFLEAMTVIQVPVYKRVPMYLAVRAFGEPHFAKQKKD